MAFAHPSSHKPINAFQHQAAYFAQLQSQLLSQQAIILDQQRLAQAHHAALLAGRQPDPHEFYRPLSSPPSEPPYAPDQDSVAAASTNPLVASALARRNRQTQESAPRPASIAQPHPVRQAHHRRSSSALSSTNAFDELRADTSSPSTVASHTSSHTSPPPTLILSAPGQAYPSATSPTSSASGSLDLSATDPIEALSFTQPESDLGPVESKPKRPSQAKALDAALRGRRSRPVSFNGIGTPSGETIVGPDGPRRTASGSLAAPSAALGSSTLSPLAPNFEFNPDLAAKRKQQQDAARYAAFRASHGSPLSSGRNEGFAAIALRQPRGPASESEFEAKNFTVRLRRQALDALFSNSRITLRS